MLFAAWLKSMSSPSAFREPWFRRKTTKHSLRPQVGGVVGNEVPGRALACQGSWLPCGLSAHTQTLLGISRRLIQASLPLPEQQVPASFSVGGAVGKGFNLTEI